MTEAQLADHQKRIGGSNGFKSATKPKIVPKGVKVNATEEMLAQQIALLCKDYPAPVRQYKYLSDRNFKGDFVWHGTYLAVEVDGSVHRIKERFAEDCRRQNELKFAGWNIFRVTGKMVRDGEAIKIVLRALDWADRRRKPF